MQGATSMTSSFMLSTATGMIRTGLQVVTQDPDEIATEKVTKPS